MSLRCRPERNKIVLAGNLHPHYRGVVLQYLGSHNVQVETIPVLHNGALDPEAFDRFIDEEVAGVLLQSPNFLD